MAKKTIISVPLFSLVLIFLCSSFAFAQNSISGIVFDPQNQPVNDLDIELLDSFERMIASRKTNGSGFYTFQRLRAGIYYLKVRQGATAFKESKMRIDLGDLNAIGGVDQKQVDIRLEYDRPAESRRPEVTGVVFAQNVPEHARRHYEKAAGHSKKGRVKEALRELHSALEIFPGYYKALELLGDVHLADGSAEDAASAYARAVSVNPRCFGCYFNLAVAQNKLGRKTDSAASLYRANEIDSGSINAHLLLGIVLRELGKHPEAETALTKAKELSGDSEPDVNWQLAELYYFDLKAPEKAVTELRAFIRNLSSEEKRNNSGKIDGIERLIEKIEAEIGASR